MKQKRFYKNVTVEPCSDEEGNNGFRILLDGRKLSTPLHKPLILNTQALAQIIADEWNDQKEYLNPDRMPVTRLLNVVIDKANDTRDAMIEEVVKYATTDLICYRVSSPEGIAGRQHELWQPILDWAKNVNGLEFITFTDSFAVGQKLETIEKLRSILKDLSDLELTALTHMTETMGSAILAHALINQIIDAETAFKAIRIEEDHQASVWGNDDEDLEKSALKHNDIIAVEKLLKALN